jgi:predicted DsbA family dithiol-disulfide isomerase
LPSTSEAHRLVQLAVDEGRHANVAIAIFRAYFERGADIGDVKVLEQLGAEAGLGDKTLQSFRETRAGDAVLAGSEERLRGFGVRTVPNLLFGGRVLVPGTVNVATYVHALDQALFPSEDGDAAEVPTLH